MACVVGCDRRTSTRRPVVACPAFRSQCVCYFCRFFFVLQHPPPSAKELMSVIVIMLRELLSIALYCL